nr:MAG TPA: hypothetical protein [Bacteriophage sp.]
MACLLHIVCLVQMLNRHISALNCLKSLKPILVLNWQMPISRTQKRFQI